MGSWQFLVISAKLIYSKIIIIIIIVHCAYYCAFSFLFKEATVTLLGSADPSRNRIVLLM